MISPRERTLAVLQRWSGDNTDIPSFDVTLEDYWNKTKPTGKPSHSAVPFYQQGAEDLVNKLTAEFKKSKPYLVNITFKDLEPTNGPIKTIKLLLKASSQFPEAHFSPVAALLTPEAHEALVQDIVARLEPKLTALNNKTDDSSTASVKRTGQKTAVKKGSPRKGGKPA